jgi:thymidylate kinase
VSSGGRVVALEGASGAGKSTAARRVARSLGGVRLAEAYRRLRPVPSLALGTPTALARLEARLLREEARRYVEARRCADGGRTVIADTGFLGPLSYSRALVALGLAPASLPGPLFHAADRRLTAGRWGLPDLIVYLSVPERTLRQRVADDARGHPRTWADRHAAAGRIERLLYARALAPCLGPHLVMVRASGPPADVARRIVRTVRARPAGPVDRALARTVLRALARYPLPVPSAGRPAPVLGNR